MSASAHPAARARARTRLFDYVVRRWGRANNGHFVNPRESIPLRRARRKFVEHFARETSRAHPLELVTLTREGVILAHLRNGRAVDPTTLVADAARFSGQLHAPEAR